MGWGGTGVLKTRKNEKSSPTSSHRSFFNGNERTEGKPVLLSDDFIRTSLFLYFSPSLAPRKVPTPVITITGINPKGAKSDFSSSSVVTVVTLKSAPREEAGVRGICAQRQLTPGKMTQSLGLLGRCLFRSSSHRRVCARRSGRHWPQGH